MAKARGGLGKGLDALFEENTSSGPETPPSVMAIGDIEPNRDQPRKEFDQASLSDLADSIRQYGVLQPLLVRPMPDGIYQLVAGERRWRAARMAGLSQVPVIIRELSDTETMALALIENLQREDLNPMEEAAGYRDLMERFGLTQEQVSAKVGKSRPVITNAMRLLNLPDSVRALVETQQLSAGHGRALLSLDSEEEICRAANEVIKKGLSVRQTEALVKKMKTKDQKPVQQTAWNNSYYTEVQLALSESLSRKVKVSGAAGEKEKGTLTIEFYGEEDLRNLAALFQRLEGE